MDKDYLELKKWLADTRDEPLEGMAGFFDARIDQYEDHMLPWKAHYEKMADIFPPEAENLLDIGCGSGLELDAVFGRYPALKVTAIDLSGEMLARLCRKHSDKAVTLICDDYFRRDFGKECFDAALSFETLHHFTAEKKTGLFQKIYQCLKPGGIYLECDYIAPSQEIEDLTFAECARRRRRDGIPEDVFVHFDTPLTLEHEIKCIREGGFAKVEVIGFLPGDNHTPFIRAVK